MKSETMWDKLAKNWDTPGVSLGENDLKIIERTKNISMQTLSSWTMDVPQVQSPLKLPAWQKKSGELTYPQT